MRMYRIFQVSLKDRRVWNVFLERFATNDEMKEHCKKLDYEDFIFYGEAT